MKIFFFEHNYLRDRQLDTIKRFFNDKRYDVVNFKNFEKRKGEQVSAQKANSNKITKNLKQKLPLVNIKLRPRNAPSDSVVYLWGGLILSGDFIVDLDNPWSLTGFNLGAMRLYKPLIRSILLSRRCLEIRCLSKACRESLNILFGKAVYEKSKVYYPVIEKINSSDILMQDNCRFLFVGTQFEIKGGSALIRAFSKHAQRHSSSNLTIVSHVPRSSLSVIEQCPSIKVFEAKYSREEILNNFLSQSDVLILPTYVESFGMIVMEALAQGLAVIASDVYAIGEMVNSRNGVLISPPISIWDKYNPSKYYWDIENIKGHIQALNTDGFEDSLEAAMDLFVDKKFRESARLESLNIFKEISQC